MSSLQGRSAIRSWVLAICFGQVLAAPYASHVWKATKFTGAADRAAVVHPSAQGTLARLAHTVECTYLAVVSLSHVPLAIPKMLISRTILSGFEAVSLIL